MSLIATARALDDVRFKWRVRAALLKISAIRKNSQLAAEILFAENVLRNPMAEAPVLEALCACDYGVSDNVTVDEINTVNTEAVSDETLTYITEVNFGWLAEQWAEGSLNTQPNVSSFGGTATGF